MFRRRPRSESRPLPSRNTTNRAENPSSGIVASAASASAATAARRNCMTASAATAISGGWHARTAADLPSAHQQRRQPLGELGQLDRSTRGLACGNGLDMPGHLAVRGEREDRCRVVEIADRQAAGPAASTPMARARRAVTSRNGRAGALNSRKAASVASVMPSTGNAATASLLDVMITGRPERNSASPRSTATCAGSPSKPDFVPPLMSHT